MPQHFPGLAENIGLVSSLGAAMISPAWYSTRLARLPWAGSADRIGAKKSVLVYAAPRPCRHRRLLVVRTPMAYLVAGGVFGLGYSFATVACP
jgi:hypothetical protein